MDAVLVIWMLWWLNSSPAMVSTTIEMPSISVCMKAKRQFDQENWTSSDTWKMIYKSSGQMQKGLSNSAIFITAKCIER